MKPRVPISSESEAKEKLIVFVYEYLNNSGASHAAKMFLDEIRYDQPIAYNQFDGPGFLANWWYVFWDLYCASPDKKNMRIRGEPTNEARSFHDFGLRNNDMSPSFGQQSSNTTSPLAVINPHQHQPQHGNNLMMGNLNGGLVHASMVLGNQARYQGHLGRVINQQPPIVGSLNQRIQTQMVPSHQHLHSNSSPIIGSHPLLHQGGAGGAIVGSPRYVIQHHPGPVLSSSNSGLQSSNSASIGSSPGPSPGHNNQHRATPNNHTSSPHHLQKSGQPGPSVQGQQLNQVVQQVHTSPNQQQQQQQQHHQHQQNQAGGPSWHTNFELSSPIDQQQQEQQQQQCFISGPSSGSSNQQQNDQFNQTLIMAPDGSMLEVKSIGEEANSQQQQQQQQSQQDEYVMSADYSQQTSEDDGGELLKLKERLEAGEADPSIAFELDFSDSRSKW